LRIGQHFLVNEGIIKKIVSYVDFGLRPIIEIGGGKGGLTSFLNPDIVIELDLGLINYLKKYNLVVSDARYLPTNRGQIVSSLPFYITSDFMKEIIKLDDITKLVLVLQKDFIDKVLSIPTTISFLLNYYYTIELREVIPPIYFRPKPRVFSQIVIFQRVRKYNSTINAIIECIGKYRNKDLSRVIKICNLNKNCKAVKRKVRDFKPWQIIELLNLLGIESV